MTATESKTLVCLTEALAEARKDLYEYYCASGIRDEELRVARLIQSEAGTWLYDDNDNWVGEGPAPSAEQLEYSQAVLAAWPRYKELGKVVSLTYSAYRTAGGPPVTPYTRERAWFYYQ